MLSFKGNIKSYEQNMGTLHYKGFTGSVEYSEENHCLFGEVFGLANAFISYEGKDIDELRKDFEGAVDDHIASIKLQEKGK